MNLKEARGLLFSSLYAERFALYLFTIIVYN
jgi:hypothetical protein